MTTPFPDPYGVVYYGTGERATLDPRGGPDTKLPFGVNTISVSTLHTGELTVLVYTNVEWTESVVLGVIPAGSGPRSISATYGVKPEEYGGVSVRADATMDPDVRAYVSVVTLPLKA